MGINIIMIIHKIGFLSMFKSLILITFIIFFFEKLINNSIFES